MQYGYCLGTDFVKGNTEGEVLFNAIVKAGFDYVELRLSEISALSTDEIAKLKKVLQAIPCKAGYVFFPSGLTLVGPEMDMPGINSYLDRMLPLAAELGAEVLVFGNGKARSIPEGSTYEATWQDLRKIVEAMDAKAKKIGLPILVEALNTNESNIITSYGEAVALTEGLTYVSSMVDSYHVEKDGQTYNDVHKHPEAMRHLHTAYTPGRLAPSPEDDMSLYANFVEMVKKLGYNGKISVEGGLRTTEPEAVDAEVKACLATLKLLFG